ncbi:hypothetical protein CFOL_v3_26398 [Cephalotus follicularis]|uniref:26S proteasome non-ATPase regulatory subunit 1/RPN2 N-terminal domain-containing protein n=1 Tax=Cephalotus follicularis TaxID=3775 RepID=A0A1Q3CRT6_CEPFO|nr:hypothetical protein CFOL_v3_26398 [Cephalotus follicularis]
MRVFSGVLMVLVAREPTQRVWWNESSEYGVVTDSWRVTKRNVEGIVERMLDKYIMDGKYQQAMGIAIECRRFDKLEEAIIRSDNVQGTLSYCINVSHSFVNRREYRREVLRLLVNVYQKLPSPDY